MDDNKVLRENIKEVVEEHTLQHGNYRCPKCGGIILKDWVKNFKLICPKCYSVMTAGMVRLERIDGLMNVQTSL